MRMRTYIVRRLLLLIPVLIGISIFVFCLTRIGGDPAALYANPHMTDEQRDLIRESMHLDDDILTQYFYWLSAIFRGDWGTDPTNGDVPVMQSIMEFFPATLELTIVSVFIAVILGIYLGTLSSSHKDRAVDHATRILALVGVSLPIFVMALVLQYVFYSCLGWLPAVYQYDVVLFSRYAAGWNTYTGMFLVDSLLNGNLVMFIDGVKHIILPSLTLAFSMVGVITRLMRSSMLEVMDLDYIKAARSKGLPERQVIGRHARRNALIPTATVVGMSFGTLLGGAVITETIFAWPGLGRWSTQAIVQLATAPIMGFVLFTAVLIVLSSLVVDILYAYLDPRVKLG